MLSSLAVVGMNAAFLAYVVFSLRGAIKEAHAKVRLRIKQTMSSFGGGTPALHDAGGGGKGKEQSMSTEVEMVAKEVPAVPMHTNRMFDARGSPQAAGSASTTAAIDAPAPQSLKKERTPAAKWTELTAESGMPYYCNADTGETSWSKPNGAA